MERHFAGKCPPLETLTQREDSQHVPGTQKGIRNLTRSSGRATGAEEKHKVLDAGCPAGHSEKLVPGREH